MINCWGFTAVWLIESKLTQDVSNIRFFSVFSIVHAKFLNSWVGGPKRNINQMFVIIFYRGHPVVLILTIVHI